MKQKLKLAGRFLAIGAMAVLLSGCIKFTEDLTISEDNTVEGEVTLAVSKELIDMTGSSPEEVLADMAADAPVPEGIEADVSEYDDGEFIGNTYTFSGATLDQMSSMGEFTIERVGDTFEVSGSADVTDSGVDPNDPMVQGMLDTFEVRLSITFPGKVSSADEHAQVDGNKVTWEPTLGEAWEIHAVGSAIPSGGGIMMWLLIGAGVVVVLLVLFFLMSKKGKPAPAMAEGEPMAGFDTSMAAGAPAMTEAPAPPPAEPMPPDSASEARDPSGGDPSGGDSSGSPD